MPAIPSRIPMPADFISSINIISTESITKPFSPPAVAAREATLLTKSLGNLTNIEPFYISKSGWNSLLSGIGVEGLQLCFYYDNVNKKIFIRIVKVVTDGINHYINQISVPNRWGKYNLFYTKFGIPLWNGSAVQVDTTTFGSISSGKTNYENTFRIAGSSIFSISGWAIFKRDLDKIITLPDFRGIKIHLGCNNEPNPQLHLYFEVFKTTSTTPFEIWTTDTVATGIGCPPIGHCP